MSSSVPQYPRALPVPARRSPGPQADGAFPHDPGRNAPIRPNVTAPTAPSTRLQGCGAAIGPCRRCRMARPATSSSSSRGLRSRCRSVRSCNGKGGGLRITSADWRAPTQPLKTSPSRAGDLRPVHPPQGTSAANRGSRAGEAPGQPARYNTCQGDISTISSVLSDTRRLVRRRLGDDPHCDLRTIGT